MIQLIKSKNGIPVLNYKGRFLNSPYDPVKEIEEQYNRIKSRDCDMYIMFGFSSAIYFDIYPKDKILVIYEPDENIFETTIELFKLKEQPPPPNVHVFTSLIDLESFLDKNTSVITTYEIVINQAYVGLFPDIFPQFFKIIRSVKQVKGSTHTTLVNLGEVIVKRMLYNVENINKAQGINALKDSLKGVPSVVVSPSPSLGKNVRYLKALKKQGGLIICTNPALSVLVKWNIKPHILTCIEAQNLSYHIKPYEDFLDETYLFLLDQTHENIYNIKSKGIFTFGNRFDKSSQYFQKRLSKIYDKGTIPIGGSVATAGLSIAYELGCNPIVLIGQDLSFSAGRNYAKGTKDENLIIKEEKDGRYVFKRTS